MKYVTVQEALSFFVLGVMIYGATKIHTGFGIIVGGFVALIIINMEWKK